MMAATKEFILRLPEEILQQIIEYAAPIEGARYVYKRSQYDCDLSALRKLARTCRRLRRNVLPLMYRKLSIGRDSHNRQLLRLPVEEPTMSLFQLHCRELRVAIHDSNPLANAPFPLLRELVCHLPKVHNMTVDGGYDRHPQEAWALIRLALQNMPHARSLKLSRKGWGLYLRDAFRHIESSSLQILEMHGVSRPKDAREDDYILGEVRALPATVVQAQTDQIHRRNEPPHSHPSA